jgi:methionine synthase II (cobalamin-independent)
VKGQLTGPVTLGLGAADDDGRPIFFDAELREAAVRATAAAARRQTEMLGAARRLAIVSADEPTLAVLGAAAYLGVAPDDAREALAAVLAAIREAGGVPAVHCCGAADWEIPIAAGAEVIFADTFGYGASLAAAAAAVRGLLERGGRIGWGAVPTDEARVGATVSGMLDRWREAEEALARAGIDRGTLRRQSLLTPACGCGSLEIGAARRVFEDLRALRERLRSDLGCR